MFLRNAWYVVAESNEIANDTILARTIQGQHIVVFRGEGGRPVMLRDRCCHRLAPLSMGELVEGGRIRCNYHGLIYDSAGKCVHVPGQKAIPPGAEVKHYPTAEKYDWIWAWMGDVQAADESLIPDFHWNTEPGWAAVGEHIVMKGQYQLLIDNLLDLSHLAYLHVRTIGTVDVAERATAKTTRFPNYVRVERVTRNAAPPPMWTKAPKLKGHTHVDRWQRIDYHPPGTVLIETIATPLGQGDDHDRRLTYPVAMVTNFITPETDGSLHYFWRHVRNYDVDDAEVSSHVLDQIRITFVEDTGMIEGQQRNQDLDRSVVKADIGYDSGAIEGRRLLEQLVRSETGAAAAAE